jgi:hypothetical protein
MGADRTLWNEYRATWEAFSRKLDELQSCVEAGDRRRAEEALLAVERARLVHNAARDRLAAHLSGEIAALDRKALDDSERQRVRHTAQLLWEIAGKPSGTADSDWLRAEQLVRSASAS